MKILQERYPKGTWKNQKTDGRYIDGFLYKNMEVMVDKIVEDMTFLGVCSSSTFEVGTGKSVLMTQLGEIWTKMVNDKHGLDLEFTMKNIVFRPEELIERAFELPKYSCILLDEWEDAHYWSKIGKTLRQFFRKCRQLNLFIIVIIPNFFQLPLNYAISRSAFFIDVKFADGFTRGHFDFYSFNKKRDLYIRGKKTHNYNVTLPDFNGIFQDGYGVNEKEYRQAKLLDMMKYDEEKKKEKTPTQIRNETIRKVYWGLKKKFTKKELAEAVELSPRHLRDIISKEKGVVSKESLKGEVGGNDYTILQKGKKDNLVEPAPEKKS